MKLNNTLLILDTETGGVDANRDSLMEIACIVLKDNKIVKEYSAFVKSPTGKYVCNDFARKLHGITNEIIEKNGKLPIDIIIDLKEIKDIYFDGEPMTIVAHNAAFDISFVKKMFSDNGQDLLSISTQNELDYNNIFSRNSIDTATMALVLRLQNKLPFDRCSLDNILKYYQIPIDKIERHSAIYDARQTAKAFICMFNELSGKKMPHLDNSNTYETGFDDSKKIK